MKKNGWQPTPGEPPRTRSLRIAADVRELVEAAAAHGEWRSKVCEDRAEAIRERGRIKYAAKRIAGGRYSVETRITEDDNTVTLHIKITDPNRTRRAAAKGAQK